MTAPEPATESDPRTVNSDETAPASQTWAEMNDNDGW
jgi:hypothetical protein